MTALAILASPAAANGSADFVKTYGNALPPIGYVDYCKRSPEACKPKRQSGKRLAMTEERWRIVQDINTAVNAKITPVSDADLYGQPEFWALPTDAGDCEDYLLLKKKYLEGLGFPPGALLITVVLDENRQGHAILTLATDTGDFVLDNRRDGILRWSDTGYRFLKRQSPHNPNVWVALIEPSRKASITLSGTRSEH